MVHRHMQAKHRAHKIEIRINKTKNHLKFKLGTMVHTSDTSTQGTEAGGLAWVSS